MNDSMSRPRHHTAEHRHAQTAKSEAAASHEGHDHEAMIADFRRRFWVSLALTVPILLLSPMIQRFLGLDQKLAFPGDVYVLFGLASIVYFWGGWPFLKGIARELTARRPGMMTLYVRLARGEEHKAEAEFGDEYRAYARRVPAFLPRLSSARVRGPA